MEATCQNTSDAVFLVNALIDKHEKQVKRYVAQRSGPKVLQKSTVEDVFQDAVAAAVESASEYAHVDDTHFLGWIYTIVRRVISRLMRQNQGQFFCQRIKGACSTGPGIGYDEIHAPIRSPSSFAAVEERTGIMRSAIQTLPTLHREVITLYKLRQLSLAEVAHRIGRSEGQTSRIAAESLKTLRSRLPPR